VSEGSKQIKQKNRFATSKSLFFRRKLRVIVGRGLERPITFWLPGIFLFLIGFGNTVVGVMKADQFDEVLQELASAKQYKEEVSSSPLMRMQLARKLTDKTFNQYSTYEERRNFYKTVAFGGKVVMALSLLLFSAACLCKSLI